MDGHPFDRSAALGRAKDALWGALIGDALGVPFEFKGAQNIPPASHIDINMAGFPGFQKTYETIPYGVWSDDGSQILCLLECLQTIGNIESADEIKQKLSELFISWRDHGHHQSGGKVFDIGGQTRVALDAFSLGQPVPGGSQSNGNGSLMRTIAVPIFAAWHDLSVAQVIHLATVQSQVTHPHLLSQAACGIYAAVAYQGLCSAKPESHMLDSWVCQAARSVARHRPDLANSVDQIIDWRDREIPTGSGFVINSLWSAIRSIQVAQNYPAAVRNAIALGNDTDTTACITGGLAAILWQGKEGIPEHWKSALVIPSASLSFLEGAPDGQVASCRKQSMVC